MIDLWRLSVISNPFRATRSNLSNICNGLASRSRILHALGGSKIYLEAVVDLQRDTGGIM